MTVFNKLQRVDVAVKDLDVATADWEQYFGTQAVRLGEDRYSRRVQFGVGDAWIALAEPLSERSPVWQFLHDRGQGVCAAALQVDDVEAVAGMLVERGVSVELDEGSGCVSLDPAATNGIRVELWPEGVESEGRTLFKRFHHIVVATNGTQAAAENWHRLFDADTGSEGGDPHTSHIPAGQAYFGLVDAADHPAPVAKFLKERGEGAYIVSVIDDEPERTVKAIRERGGRVVGDESGRGQLFVHPASTHGVLLEINDEEQTRHWAATYGDPPFDR
jgi:hypothetical protein